MEKINISFATVRQKTERLKQQVNQGMFLDILERYASLQNNLEQSCGLGVDAIREELEQERQSLTEVGIFMIELLEFIQDSADAFEKVDVKYEGIMKKFV